MTRCCWTFWVLQRCPSRCGHRHLQNRTILWNEENRVKEIDDQGSSVVFLYDDGGERAVKRGQYGETVYVNRFYSVKNGDLGSNGIYTGLNSGGGIKRGINRRLPNPDGTYNTVNPPLEKFEYFYHPDHLGSSSFITDDAGAVYQHLEYFPYGETWVEEGNGTKLSGYMFTGKELDPETGLYYYGARYYDPVLSRWISADPAFEKFLPKAGMASGLGIKKDKLGSEPGKPRYQSATWMLLNYSWRSNQAPQSNAFAEAKSNRVLDPYAKIFEPSALHSFTYVANNPLQFVDPTGLFKLHLENLSKKEIETINKAVSSINNAINQKDSLAKQYFDKLGVHIKTVVKPGEGSDVYVGDAGAYGYYNSITNNIVIDKKTLQSDQATAATLIHETALGQ